MRDLTDRLFAVLERKLAVMNALIEKQEALKQFLVEPDWSQFNDVTRPQEGLLRELQQVHQEQNSLLDRMGSRSYVGAKPTLKWLAEQLEPTLRQRLEQLRSVLAEKVAQLRKLSRLSQRLSQAQWDFAKACLAGGSAALSNAQQQSTYTAAGYQGSAMPQQLVAGVYGDA
jgi:hypothetical protein